jgi:hypothetical protein
MGIEHVEMALVGRQVHRLTDHAAGMMQPGNRLVQFHQRGEIVIAGVAAAAVEIVHEGWPPGGAEHRAVAAQLHCVAGIARVLVKFPWRRCLYGAAAEARLEAHPLTLHVAASGTENLQDFGIAGEIHAGVLENDIGILFNQR